MFVVIKCVGEHIRASVIMISASVLCSTLTITHSVALGFLNDGGLPLLLSFPAGSLFVVFDNVAASIIHHILEDPHTIQQAMESEMRQSVVTTISRQPNERHTPHNFLLNLSSAALREPAIFIQAAHSVYQIEMIGDRPYIILLKDREKYNPKKKKTRKKKHRLS
ncbi:hypothetical protein Tco_0760048 [Tanacetum coccineum]